ncbi:MAG: DEAD/DEAH box helicase [candidate division WOR-3 bacterium]|nr:MAG: DEAD/DEAH box helicase [candidate division WOR-3 bacterium]
MGAEQIRRSLPRTWFPFFSRFGRLTEVQERTIPPVLLGRNVVVISPSASGKTEAIAAPLVERNLTSGSDRCAVFYISPTRALVNDLHRRLMDPIEYLGLGLDRKTGDHPSVDEKRMPFMLVTTPESTDSLLCRHPAIFRRVSAVVLDELHLLDNSPRGDQLRVLLNRLRLINDHVQFCAMSATIDDTGIGERYFAGSEVVKIDEQRRIDRLLLAMGPDWQEQVVSVLRARACHKVLCFFNSRSGAESASRELDIPPFKNRVWVHHASLSRKTREEVERTMNRERIGMLCCTSTLELGIDIGDIDAVVLVRPPFNVSSLLQRIGRGNRRQDSDLFAVGLYTNGWERFLFDTFFESARAGRLYEKRYTASLSVIPQQIASYLYQRRRIGTTARSVQRVFQGLYTDLEPVRRTLDHLIDQDAVVAERPGVYQPGTRLEKQVRFGKIHSNIQQKSFGKYEVFEVSTRKRLGTVFFLFRTFVLGGRTWELVKFDENDSTILVRPCQEVGATTQVFEGTGTGGYGYRMAQVLKSRLFPDLAPDQFPYYVESGQTFVVHLLGATYGYLLTEAFGIQGVGATDLDGKLLALPGDEQDLEGFPVPELQSIREVVRKNIARLEDNLGSGAFLRMLPRELQIDDHLLTLDIEGLLRFLAGIRLVELPAAEVSDRIRQHVSAGNEAHTD